MGYTTYENRNNPHVTIHKDGCNQIGKRGGVGRGMYKKHNTLQSAQEYAERTGLTIIICSFCNPKKK